MIESLVSALLVAAVSGVVFVAYRHPQAFAKLHANLKKPLGLGALAVVSFLLGQSETQAGVHNALSKLFADKPAERDAALAALTDEYTISVWILGGIGALWLFLEALGALPRMGIVAASPASDAADPRSPSASPFRSPTR